MSIILIAYCVPLDYLIPGPNLIPGPHLIPRSMAPPCHCAWPSEGPPQASLSLCGPPAASRTLHMGRGQGPGAGPGIRRGGNKVGPGNKATNRQSM